MPNKKLKKIEEQFKMVKVSTVLYAILIVIVVAFIVMSILAYGTNTAIGKKLSASFSRVIPFPAVMVGYTNFIPLGDVQKNVASVKKFYENQDFSGSGIRIDFSTADGQKRLMLKEKEVLNKMLEDKVIMMLAKERGIKISKSEIDNDVTKKLNEYGTKDDVIKDLDRLYGWSLDDFKTKVVEPSMYRERLSKAVENELEPAEDAKAKIENAKKELDKGADFAEIAKRFSEGSSAKNGGEIGWIKKEQLVTELQSVLFSGIYNNKEHAVIESALGFHIVEVEEKKKDGDVDVIRVRQIFVRKESFSDWLSQQMGKLKIYVPLSDFAWDKENTVIDFKDEGMKKFEGEIMQKPQGDASVIF
jgi:parvulin-like peptidyl-prolyl isomerase